MSKHWRKSTIPYFAVIQDYSEVSPNAFQTEKNNSLVNSDQLSNEVLFNPKNSYPEIRYVFEDDANYEAIEEEIDENEEAFVIDLDENGQQIQGATSLTADLQILNVNMKDKNYTKTIEIETTRPELKNTDSIVPEKNLEHIIKLVELYRLRSNQLDTLLQNS